MKKAISVLLIIIAIFIVGIIAVFGIVAYKTPGQLKNIEVWIGIGMTLSGLIATVAGIVLAIYGYYNINRAEEIVDMKLKKELKSFRSEMYNEISRVQEATQKVIAGYQSNINGNIDVAISLYEEAVKIFPEVFNGYSSLGYAYLQKGQKVKALEAFQKAKELFPNRVETYNDLARVYAYLNETDLCLENLKITLAMKPQEYANIENDDAFSPLLETSEEFRDSFKKYIEDARKKLEG